MTTEFKLVPVEPTEEMLEVLHSHVKIQVDTWERTADIINDKECWAAVVAVAPASPQASHPVAFQDRVKPWLLECFGEAISADQQERNHRFLEEALELVQANQCAADEAHQLVDYVYGRAAGDPAQEVGGVMVTLAALCLAAGLDMHADGETELARIWTKVEQIRAKQAAKPSMSPLPGVYPERAHADAGDINDEPGEAVALYEDARDACSEIERDGVPGDVIRELNDEIVTLRAGFYQQVTGADIKKIEAYLSNPELPEDSFSMRVYAAYLANTTMHIVREVQSLRAQLAERDAQLEAAAKPVKLPGRKSAVDTFSTYGLGECAGWNKCLDALGAAFGVE